LSSELQRRVPTREASRLPKPAACGAPRCASRTWNLHRPLRRRSEAAMRLATPFRPKLAESFVPEPQRVEGRFHPFDVRPASPDRAGDHRSGLRRTLATFKPIFSHRASPPKARATIALDSWSIRFEPGRCHGSTCLRLRTKGSCELLTASWRTRSAARRDEAGVLSVGSFKPETNHGVPHAHRRLCNGGASRRSVPSSLGCSGGGLKETVLAGLPEDQLLGRPASE
jgi:hypothetical protein